MPVRRLPSAPASAKFFGLTALLLSAAVGCEKAQEVFDQAKQEVQTAATHATEAVSQTAGTAGSIELQLDRAINMPGCYVSLIRLTGRPTVLQVTSYHDPAAESFPSLFLRAMPNQSEPGALAGQTYAAEMYVQENPDGPLWHTTDDRPAEIVVSSADANSLSAELQGLLVNSSTGQSKAISGKLNGSLKILP